LNNSNWAGFARRCHPSLSIIWIEYGFDSIRLSRTRRSSDSLSSAARRSTARRTLLTSFSRSMKKLKSFTK